MGVNVGNATGQVTKLVAAVGAKQDELERVARVLHEEVGQVLTVVGLHLEVLSQDFGGQNAELGDKVKEIQQLLEHAIEDVRKLSYELNPAVVPRSGLRYALDTLVGRIRDESGATVRLLVDSHVHLPLPAAVTMYEVAEQALRNAVQHAEATRIEVVLQPVQDLVRLEIRDNGKGFDTSDYSDHGLGFVWMEYKTRRTGVSLSVESVLGAGTTVHATYREPAEGRKGQPSETIRSQDIGK